MPGVFARAFVVWLVIIAAETVHGTLRVMLLEPVTGDFRARQIGVFTGTLMILSISVLTIRWIGTSGRGRPLLIGLFWAALTVMFEIALGRIVLGLTWRRILSDYDLTQGGLMSFGLVFMALSPLLAARLRGRFD
jgi:hypothetical protein